MLIEFCFYALFISGPYYRKGSRSEDVRRLDLIFFDNRIFCFYVLCISDHFGRKGSRPEDVRRLDGTCRPESGALPTAGGSKSGDCWTDLFFFFIFNIEEIFFAIPVIRDQSPEHFRPLELPRSTGFIYYSLLSESQISE